MENEQELLALLDKRLTEAFNITKAFVWEHWYEPMLTHGNTEGAGLFDSDGKTKDGEWRI